MVKGTFKFKLVDGRWFYTLVVDDTITGFHKEVRESSRRIQHMASCFPWLLDGVMEECRAVLLEKDKNADNYGTILD